MSESGELSLVPTPIGNLGDVTRRSGETLAAADIIACEDTRRTGSLLKELGIVYRKLTSFHEHNEINKAKSICDEIESGRTVALVTDAGTPSISDPGYRLVAEAIERGIKIVSLPGPTAFVPALAASGLPVDKFAFIGFPPQKKGRRKFLTEAAEIPLTTILYESPHKIERLVGELFEICGGERRICVAREISKVYEEYIRGTLAEVMKIVTERKIKGEIVVVLEGKKAKK